MNTDSFATYIRRLRNRLEDPLPGIEAQSTMAPAYRADPSVLTVNGKDCREAGVLVLLFPDDATPHIVLTVRRDHLPDHAGQISFPGGQREQDESLRTTALREAHEEVNLDPSHVEVLGALTPLYIPPSNFCVHPFVGAASGPLALRPTDAEVGTILQVSLPHLLHPSTRTWETWTLHGNEVDVPFFDVNGYKVWGATAMMLAEFLALCAEVFPTPS
jgi:8-oxo-dGTP pyrophosphatase MutT (NUDIX family)